MKQGIHPQYVECTVTCSCGNTFKTHATVSEMKVELCNECTRSTPASRSSSTPVDASSASPTSSVAPLPLSSRRPRRPSCQAAKAAEAEAPARPPLRLRLREG